MSDIMPENILVNADAWLDAKDSKLIVGFDTLYCLKSTADAQQAELLIKLQEEIDQNLELWDADVDDHNKTIRELAAVLEFLIGDIYWRENSPALDYLIKTLNDNDKQITESKEGEK